MAVKGNIFKLSSFYKNIIILFFFNFDIICNRSNDLLDATSCIMLEIIKLVTKNS